MVGSRRKRIALVAAALVACALGGIVVAAPGVTTLPTGWKIRGPEGPVATVGTLPESVVLSRDGAQLFVLEAGKRKPVLRVLDAATLHDVRSIALSGGYGVPLRDPDGDGLWVGIAGTFQEQIAHVDPATGTIDRDVSLPGPFYPSAIARGPGGMLAVAGDLANRVVFVDPSAERIAASIPVGRHPAALAFTPDGRTLYVADRAESTLDVIDVAAHAVRSRIAVGLHPSALLTSGTTLYVADADDDDVRAIDTVRNVVTAVARMPFARAEGPGTSPNALAVAGSRLYVSCGAANAIAVFRIAAGALAPIGAIPTGWYPTAVTVDSARGALYVANGKGESSHANPLYKPLARNSPQYIADQLTGSVRRLAIPSDAALSAGLADVRDLAQHEGAPANAVVRASGPIAHVIYVIKENRTYDQVFGDVTSADGDASLALFGEKITPNQHALARRFGVFDRFFENSHVSADGHNWATAAFANDYLERMWPPSYGGRRPLYDFEDAAEAGRPKAGYLWNLAVAHRISLRNYGEYVTAGASAPTPVSVSDDALRPRTDRAFATFDMKVADVDRFVEWKREFDEYERTRTLPQLEIVRFPRDHTNGTSPESETPQAMVADNDQAVGKLVEAVSHSDDWGSTAIFVIEDDAQNGPDHVDEQRAPFLLISPYSGGGTQHAMYTQASVLRTIEILLGLPPMSAYDAGALPLTAAFRERPELQAFDALPPSIDLHAKNGVTAYRAADSARLDFDVADAVDEATLNDILWHAVKGPHATPPPYGAFR